MEKNLTTFRLRWFMPKDSPTICTTFIDSIDKLHALMSFIAQLNKSSRGNFITLKNHRDFFRCRIEDLGVRQEKMDS